MQSQVELKLQDAKSKSRISRSNFSEWVTTVQTLEQSKKHHNNRQGDQSDCQCLDNPSRHSPLCQLYSHCKKCRKEVFYRHPLDWCHKCRLCEQCQHGKDCPADDNSCPYCDTWCPKSTTTADLESKLNDLQSKLCTTT